MNYKDDIVNSIHKLSNEYLDALIGSEEFADAVIQLLYMDSPGYDYDRKQVGRGSKLLMKVRRIMEPQILFFVTCIFAAISLIFSARICQGNVENYKMALEICLVYIYTTVLLASMSFICLITKWLIRLHRIGISIRAAVIGMIKLD